MQRDGPRSLSLSVRALLRLLFYAHCFDSSLCVSRSRCHFRMPSPARRSLYLAALVLFNYNHSTARREAGARSARKNREISIKLRDEIFRRAQLGNGVALYFPLPEAGRPIKDTAKEKPSSRLFVCINRPVPRSRPGDSQISLGKCKCPANGGSAEF